MHSTKWAAFAVALILPFLNACGIDDVNDGHVRVVNATTEYASIDLYTQDSSGNDDLVVSGTAAGTVSGYNDVSRGATTFDIKSGTGAGVAATTTGTVTTDDHFTVVTYITGNALQATFLSDEEENPSSGNAKLRVFNAASIEAGGVDVYLTTNACDALAVTDTALATDSTGLGTSFSQVTAGTWHVCVTATGNKSDVRADIPALVLKNQEIATLILTRTAGGVLLNAAVLDQQGALTPYSNSIARVRIVADAASAATVSATVNTVSLAADLASPVIDSYVTVPAGAVTAAILINDVAINGTSLPALSAGSDYTLFVGGTVSAPAVTLIADDNTPSTVTSQPVKARVVNGVNGGGTVSVSVDGKSVGSAAFAAASAYATIPATSGTSTVIISGITPKQTLTDQSFASGSVYTIFVLGDAGSEQVTPNQDH